MSPVGTKGVGELAIAGMAAAIANGVHHATGGVPALRMNNVFSKDG
jgi:CO/xanthine dehydrogenase Mo-binding subunit